MIYIIQEAFKGFGKNKSMSFITIGIICVSIFIFGLFIVGTANLMNIINIAEEKVEIVAYLKDNISQKDIDITKKRILSIAGVKGVEFISKEQALEIFKKEFENNKDLISVFEINPLPASMKLSINMAYKNPKNLKEIAQKVMLFNTVESIDYGAEWIEELDKTVKILFIIDILVGIIIGLASVFIVFNTIKLTVYARKQQIEIMDLVGATETYIEVPYVIEGIIHGLFGSLLSAGFLYLIFSFIKNKFPELIFVNISIIYILVIFGMFLGFIGSIMSVKQCISEIRESKQTKILKS